MADLVFLRDREVLLRAPLRDTALVLGRGADADLVLPDRAVSRRQCRLVPHARGWAVEDLSGRGTTLNGKSVHDLTPLRDGDTLHFGELVATFAAKSADTSTATSFTGPKPAKSRTERVSPTTQLTRAALHVEGDDGTRTLSLRPDEGFRVTVGSQPKGPVTLTLADPLASAEHFRISVKHGRWQLTDPGSTNGTFVDGVRVLDCVLGDVATIRAGETTLRFEREPAHRDAAEPAPGLVSHDPTMAPVVDAIRRYAPSRVTVSIRGESGAGKEVVARALHAWSERAGRPFVALNCGALPRETLESELFGHEKGAFTGADRARPGAFEEAGGGTLFLDEIGDLPLDAQVKLLRALESGEIRRMGGALTLKVDVRVLCASHRDLNALVESGEFREDLYYRLCVASIDLPPLRRRVADVLPLATHFARQFAPGPEVRFSPAARARLEAHPWHGNARELRNVVQTALLHRRGAVIEADDLVLRPAPKPRAKGGDQLRLDGLTLAEVERETYRRALLRHAGDKDAAMRELDVPRSTFFRRLKDLEL